MRNRDVDFEQYLGKIIGKDNKERVSLLAFSPFRRWNDSSLV
jgi:hypothetical protein